VAGGSDEWKNAAQTWERATDVSRETSIKLLQTAER
jgi:hypothetical protein